MSIPFACSCGKRMNARDEHAGKRARCSGCGKSILIPTDGRPTYDVFLSHSKADRATAEAICATLEKNGTHCWIAPRDILAGKQWGEAIIDGITQCQVMVLVFSGQSNQSRQVIREVERAVSKGLIIVPFCIDDVVMSKAMEYFLSSPHWLDAKTPPLQQHLDVLARTITALLAESQKNAGPRPHAVSEGEAPSPTRPYSALRASATHPDPSIAAPSSLPLRLQWLLQARLGWIVGACFAGAAIFGFGTWWWTTRSDHSSGVQVPANLAAEDATIGELTLPTGRLLFRTERFEPPAPPPEQVLRVGDSTQNPSPEVLELAFQLQNLSDEEITLASLRTVSFGPLQVSEDVERREFLSQPRASLNMNKRASLPDRTELSQLVFADVASSKDDMASSSNLVPSNSVAVIPPRDVRSFLLKVAIENRRAIAEVDEEDFEDDRLDTRLAQDSGKFRWTGSRLEGLYSNGRVHISAGAYDFAVVAEILWAGSGRQTLYSDGIFSIEKNDSSEHLISHRSKAEPDEDDHRIPNQADRNDGFLRHGNRISRAPLARWSVDSPAVFVRRLTDRGIKLNRETMAYLIAVEDGLLPKAGESTSIGKAPPGLAPDVVSEYCLAANPQSPFYALIPGTKYKSEELIPIPGINLTEKEELGVLHPRSNVAHLLSALRSEHPQLWMVLEAELKKLSIGSDDAMRVKAAFLLERLEAGER